MGSKLWFLPLVSLAIYLLIGATILSAPSIFNNSPFFFSDSGFYILFGHMKIDPGSLLWRPMTYSLFLSGFFSKLGPLYFIFIQNLVLITVIYFIARLCKPQNNPRHFSMILMGLLFTSLPIYSNFIMPDIFTGVMILSFTAFLIAEKSVEKNLWVLVFILSMAMHYSNLIVGSLLVLGFFLSLKIRSIKKTISLLLIPWILVSLFNYSINKQFTVSNTAHIFIFSQLSAFGVVEKYLDRACEQNENLALCQHRETAFDIWNQRPGSRIFKCGGIYKLLPEIEKVNYSILSSGHIFDILTQGAGRAFSQLVMISKPLTPLTSNKFLEKEITLFSEKLLEQFLNQKIKETNLESVLELLDITILLVFLISFLGLIYLFLKRRLPDRLQKFFVITCWAYVANAFVCGFLTDPAPRYSGSIICIFPLLILIYFSQKQSHADPSHRF